MPAIVPPPGALTGMVAAGDGWAVEVTAPPDTDTAGIPGGGAVIGWALLEDETATGGARVDPLFLAAGRAWTPDQYRAAYGEQLRFRVARA